MGKYCVKSGDSLSRLAGGDYEKLEMLIECNCQHPNIKNRKRADKYFGWLDIGECIEIPWKKNDDPECTLSPLKINNGDEPVDKPCPCRKCTLYLKVIDLYTNDPIVSASVTISPGPKSGNTDTGGRVLFEQLVDRDYSIKIEAADCKTETVTQPSHCDGDKKEVTISIYKDKPCHELFEDYRQSKGLTQAPNDSRTYGKWCELTRNDKSAHQVTEAVQNQYNFGSGAYVADPHQWQMEESIDIGEQINMSINNAGGMSICYNEASKKKKHPISFIWNDSNRPDNIRRHGFNLDPYEAINTRAWQFGRVAATIKEGIIVVCDDGSYFVKGRLVYESDTFSWATDGDGFWHNIGIRIIGNNWNAEGFGNWRHSTITSAAYLNDHSINEFDSSLDPPPGPYVKWHKHSNSYPNGEMPVHYARDYYFCTYGKPK